MEVPDNVDILIAGFACVNIFTLIKNAKLLSEVGESADTLRGIMEYSKKRPPRNHHAGEYHGSTVGADQINLEK